MDYEAGDRLLKVGEVAQRLGLGRSNVYELLDSGRIPSVRPSAGGKSLRVKASAVDAYIASLDERRAAIAGR